MWAITLEERDKHDQKFDTLSPSMGYVSGTHTATSINMLHIVICSLVFFDFSYVFCFLMSFCSFLVCFFSAGEQAKKFFLQSGLPPSVLAEIW